MRLPKVSFVIPTLNAGSVLSNCLESIFIQDYPKDRIEIIISDGGSSDNTLDIANEFKCKIVKNPLKTGESGKAVGVREAKGEYIALVDSDNILSSKTWLKEMVKPLVKHKDFVGSEPWEYTWRKEDGFIDRYCSLVGVNDPLVLFTGNYDRLNLLSGRWTEIDHQEEDHKKYILATFDRKGLPTIGANGTIFRSSYLKKELGNLDYLFDVDIVAKTIKSKGSVKLIKVKIGIIHTFCGNDIFKFSRKQRRRIRDYIFHKFNSKRDYAWENARNTVGIAKFILSCITVLPLFVSSVRGYIRKRDLAWFFHPLACEITLWQYGLWSILSLFKKSEVSRKKWKQ